MFYSLYREALTALKRASVTKRNFIVVIIDFSKPLRLQLKILIKSVSPHTLSILVLLSTNKLKIIKTHSVT